MQKKMKIILVLLLAAVALALAARLAVNRLAGTISTDQLSQGISQRWGGGLPAGYRPELANDLEHGGRLYGRLTYRESVEKLLRQWEPLDAETAAAFAELVADHLALGELSEAHRTLLEEAPAPEGDEWLCYRAEQGTAQLILLYDRSGNILYLAEKQPAAE